MFTDWHPVHVEQKRLPEKEALNQYGPICRLTYVQVALHQQIFSGHHGEDGTWIDSLIDIQHTVSSGHMIDHYTFTGRQHRRRNCAARPIGCHIPIAVSGEGVGGGQRSRRERAGVAVVVDAEPPSVQRAAVIGYIVNDGERPGTGAALPVEGAQRIGRPDGDSAKGRTREYGSRSLVIEIHQDVGITAADLVEKRDRGS